MKRDFLHITDFTREEIISFIKHSETIKANLKIENPTILSKMSPWL